MGQAGLGLDVGRSSDDGDRRPDPLARRVSADPVGVRESTWRGEASCSPTEARGGAEPPADLREGESVYAPLAHVLGTRRYLVRGVMPVAIRWRNPTLDEEEFFHGNAGSGSRGVVDLSGLSVSVGMRGGAPCFCPVSGPV